jgi:mannitol/fructose-specific phosphotransferase system IIA component (Ntr-type)
MFLVIVFLDLEHLVEAASALMILLFMLVNLCVIVMRASRVPNYRPSFRSPFYPWMQIIGIVGPLFLLVEFGLLPLTITLGFVVASFAWYVVYARPRTTRESGLVHLVERIVSRHLSKGMLRKELRQIIMERDEIVEDRFDRLVHDCAIIDIEEPVDVNGLFRKVSSVLAERIHTDEQEIFDLLWERERESSTAISPGLAVPHVIVPGDTIFDLVLVRSRQGTIFEVGSPPVTAAFVLIGSRDQRNFHLKTLAAIAQIVQNPGFDRSWMAARNPEELRDLILLAQRRRAAPPSA